MKQVAGSGGYGGGGNGDCNKVNLTRVERVGHIRPVPLAGQVEEEGEFMEGSSTFKWIHMH